MVGLLNLWFAYQPISCVQISISSMHFFWETQQWTTLLLACANEFLKNFWYPIQLDPGNIFGMVVQGASQHIFNLTWHIIFATDWLLNQTAFLNEFGCSQLMGKKDWEKTSKSHQASAASPAGNHVQTWTREKLKCNVHSTRFWEPSNDCLINLGIQCPVGLDCKTPNYFLNY